MNLPINKVIAVFCTLVFWIGSSGVFGLIAWFFGTPPEVIKYFGVMVAGAAVHDAFSEWKNTR